ncbi:MAG: hypothetical protein PHY00_02140 [Bacilli bacterium]|nr:hypothetical protein [Bacilli bacterium]
MTIFEEKIDDFLLDNTLLMDKLYFFKIYLKLKKIINLGTMPIDVNVLYEELAYLIDELKNDRDKVLSIFEIIQLADKKSLFIYSKYLKKELDKYINELRNGLVINQLYLDDKKAKFSKSELSESDYDITFDNVLQSRKSISAKQLVLSNDYVGGKKKWKQK